MKFTAHHFVLEMDGNCYYIRSSVVPAKKIPYIYYHRTAVTMRRKNSLFEARQHIR